MRYNTWIVLFCTLTTVLSLCYNLPAMSETGQKVDKNQALRSLNWTLAAVTGQVGCLTLIIIFAALFAGRWLDNKFNSNPLFTIGLMIGSVPVTLVMMFWVVRTVTRRFANRESPQIQNSEEVDTSGNSA